MPRKQNADEGDGDIALRTIELVKDKTVMKAFKEEMFPQTISNKLDLLAENPDFITNRMWSRISLSFSPTKWRILMRWS